MLPPYCSLLSYFSFCKRFLLKSRKSFWKLTLITWQFMAHQAEPQLAVLPRKPRASTFAILVFGDPRDRGRNSTGTASRAQAITSYCAWITMQIALARCGLMKMVMEVLFYYNYDDSSVTLASSAAQWKNAIGRVENCHCLTSSAGVLVILGLNSAGRKGFQWKKTWKIIWICVTSKDNKASKKFKLKFSILWFKK